MPRPPPPAAALIISGKPISSGSPSDDRNAGLAGHRFASSLSPPARSASGGGPTHVRPASSTASAKFAFSARNP